ncbi:hypothetical protein OB2597_02027 [Pseudooceanicola batsensis HTCC2597]|uniref:Uncharacterized protein n=1 Tax=Pseudooceanicola batsensis (strain ATCC BAA-863 / DSM 15984 / KCTC 12145 / HTCC2597) TaxID=252305 RepID=A3TWZ9_PSEBH|nr:hypothetical protein [Pseudooceanicola batsensis]EAQ03359.1 hypothetical protein OB2597_02027 [Pseudooceanicola batsensis HTCC2597]
MAEPRNPHDPKGLIRESYRIEGISDAECRSILMDWALSLPDDVSQPDALTGLIARYADPNPGHPMSALLIEGRQSLSTQKRRGGRAGRRH